MELEKALRIEKIKNQIFIRYMLAIIPVGIAVAVLLIFYEPHGEVFGMPSYTFQFINVMIMLIANAITLFPVKKLRKELKELKAQI